MLGRWSGQAGLAAEEPAGKAFYGQDHEGFPAWTGTAGFEGRRNFKRVCQRGKGPRRRRGGPSLKFVGKRPDPLLLGFISGGIGTNLD